MSIGRGLPDQLVHNPIARRYDLQLDSLFLVTGVVVICDVIPHEVAFHLDYAIE